LIVIQRGKRYRYLDVKKNRFDGELGIVPYRFDKNSGRVQRGLTGCERPGRRLTRGVWFFDSICRLQIIELTPAELQSLPPASASQPLET